MCLLCGRQRRTVVCACVALHNVVVKVVIVFFTSYYRMCSGTDCGLTINSVISFCFRIY